MDLLHQLKKSLLDNKSAPAFCINGVFFTYKEFYQKISGISSVIRQQKKTGSNNIGVITNNDIETYASLVACWFSGFAYIPINPSIPKERNNIVIKEASIEFVLSSSDCKK